jgi:hypothetical protein
MAYPPAPSLAAGRNILRLIFADDPAEIVRLEVATGQSQEDAVAGFVGECYEFRYVREAAFAVQLPAVRLEMRQIDPLVWRLMFEA